MKIKRIFSSAVLVLFMISSLNLFYFPVYASAPTYDDTSMEEGGSTEGWAAYADYMGKDGRLFNLYSKIEKLSEGESLNIVYFGGSITNGSNKQGGNEFDKDGNVAYAKCYREFVGDHITSLVQQKHPDSTVENRIIHPIEGGYDAVDENKIYVNNINAAIGATGSYFGVHRAYDDIGLGLSKKPDVVFLEFAYNDNRGGDSASRTYTDSNGNTVLASAADFESIILNIYKYAPDCEIIGVFTTGTGLMNNISESASSPLAAYPELSAQRAVMRKYDIPYLYVGKDLVDKIIEESGDENSILSLDSTTCTSNSYWMSYFSDQVHPNRHGYKFYADIINGFISDRLSSCESYNGDVTLKDHNALLNNTYFDRSVLKLSANQKKMADIYYDADGNESKLSYWKKNADFENNVYSASCYNDSLESTFEGASFAFRFTGRSLGFWRARSTTGGVLVANVYKVNDDGTLGELYRTSSQLIGSSSNHGLAERWPVAENMPEATYEVQVHTEASSFGASGIVRRVFINGDADSIIPVEHPDIFVSVVYDDVELLPRYVNPNEKYNLSISQTTEEDGYKFSFMKDSSSVSSMRSILWDVGTANVKDYPYLIIDYLVDDECTFAAPNLAVVVRNVSEMESSLCDVIYPSSQLAIGEWTTAVIDMSDYVTKAANNGATENSLWKRIEFYPFGTSVTRTTEGIEGAEINIRSIRLSHSKIPTAIPDGDGSMTVYVSPSGLVTMGDTGEFDAFTSFDSAFDALGEKGGIIYFQGALDFSDGTKKHGDVTVIGIGDSDILRAQNKLYVKNKNPDAFTAKYGNVKFENLSISYENAPSERWIYTEGYTMTFGKNVVIIPDTNNKRYYVHAAPFANSGTTSSTNFVFSSELASYSSVATMSGWNTNSVKFSGHVDYRFNSGVFSEVFGGARNSASGIHVGYGDVKYTFNGGTYSTAIYTGSYQNGSRYGNLTYIFNGGTLSGDVFVGSARADSGTNLGNTAIIVNCKEISETESGKIGKNMRSFGSKTAYGVPKGNNIIIINNAELAKSVNVALSSNTASKYRISVTGGKALPVFESSGLDGTIGKLLGFTLDSDDGISIPCIGNTPISKNADGYYDISMSDEIIDITFINKLDVDTTYDEEAEQKNKFTVIGAQIRVNYKNEYPEQALRFVGRIGSDVLSRFTALNKSNIKPESTASVGVGYGFVVLPEDLLDGELTKETYDAGIVPAVNLFNIESDYTEYTVCITNIKLSNYRRKYAVRPYITYLNAAGNEMTVYGEQYSTDIYSIAQSAIGSDNIDEEIKEHLKTSIIDAYDDYVAEGR